MTTSGYKSPLARRGFTLAELVVVLAIIATLAAIAVPRFASADSGFRAEGAAEQLAEAIRDAATQARSRSSTVRVRISEAGNNFNSAVRSPLQYLAIFNTNERPFYGDVTFVDFGDDGTALDINGFGEFSTSMIVGIQVGEQNRTVMVDAASGIITVGTYAEAAAFRSSASYK